MCSFKVNILPFGQDALMSQEVLIDGLEPEQNICILCGKVFQACSSPSSSIKVKETIAEMAVVDVGYLVFNEDRLGCCQTCHSKVEQLREKYTVFQQIRDELAELSTQISFELKRTNNQLLNGLRNPIKEDEEDSTFFQEWNSQRIQTMLLNNLRVEPGSGAGIVGMEEGSQQDRLDLLRPETVVAGFYESNRSEEPSTSYQVKPAPKTRSKKTTESTKTTVKTRKKRAKNEGPKTRKKKLKKDVDEDLEVFKCTTCDRSFPEYDLLQLHLQSHDVPVESLLQMNEFTCNVCSKSFNRGYSLRVHMKTHGGDGLSCDKCDEKFPNNNSLVAHRKQHDKEKVKLRCPICNKTVAQKRAMEAHLHGHHVRDYEVSAVTCDICKKTFDSPLILMLHMEVHGGEYECSVDTCKKSFKSCTLLENHEKIHTSDMTFYQCDFCTIAFKDEATFTAHKSKHSFSETFLCDHCGRSFPSKSLLRSHIRLHKSAENRCEICDKSFYSASNLKNHMRLHTGERPFQCTLCSKSFVQKVSLTLHMRKHSGVNPFMCPYCKNVGFSYKLALRQHLATKHEDVYLNSKKFLCKICWKNFVTESEQLEHDALHEKHKCKLCNRQFKMLTHLKEHLLRHASLKPHKCIFCDDKSFLRRKGLMDHLKNAHPGEDAEAAANSESITYYVHLTNR